MIRDKKSNKTEPAQSTRAGATIPLRRGIIDSVTVFEVSEYELEVLQTGDPNSIKLNLAIALLSVAISFFATVLTVKMVNIYTFITFIIILVGGFIAGLILLALWWRGRKGVLEVVKKIKARLESSETLG